MSVTLLVSDGLWDCFWAYGLQEVMPQISVEPFFAVGNAHVCYIGRDAHTHTHMEDAYQKSPGAVSLCQRRLNEAAHKKL